jgi:hypothetical protein
MKHSKKDRNPRSSEGVSKGSKEPNPNIPISIADVLEQDQLKFEKDDLCMRQMSIVRTSTCQNNKKHGIKHGHREKAESFPWKEKKLKIYYLFGMQPGGRLG